MEILLSLCIGVGLSAACGFRIFVPFLVMNLAARSGHLFLSPEFQWMSSDAAFIAFGTAAVLEISAYYLPLARQSIGHSDDTSCRGGGINIEQRHS